MHKVAIAAVLLSSLAAPAFAQPHCLMLSQIWSWKAFDNKTLIVEDNFHQKFKLGLMGYCPRLPFKLNLGFKAIGGTGLSCLTKGDEVISRDEAMGTFRCPIKSIVPYTPAMEQADKASAAAKAAQGGIR